MGVGLSNRLQKLQNKAARVIMNFSNNIPGPEAIKVLELTSETVSKYKKVKNSHKTTSGALLPRCSCINGNFFLMIEPKFGIPYTG